MAVDGDGETRWCADHGTFPQWWQVDLGKPQDLTGCLIAWEQPSAVYQYKVEGSADGKSWRMLADELQAVKGDQNRELSFAACCGKPMIDATGVRYVLITIEGSSGAWASFYDVQVFGKEMVKAGTQSLVKVAGSDPAKAISKGTIKRRRGLT